MKSSFLLIIILCNSIFAYSQVPEKVDSTFYVDTNNKLYWNKNLPVFITLSPTKGGKGHTLESIKSKEYSDPFYFDTEGLNFIRTRWAVDKKTKKTIHPQQEVLWEVYADGIKPVTKPTFIQAQKHSYKNTIFYGPNLKINLSSTDNLSGVKKLYYSLNGEQYKEFSTDISFEKEGLFSLKYYSIDNVGNMEDLNQRDFIIDLSSPKTYHSVIGIDLSGNIISVRTQIILEFSDTQSGVYKTFYSIDNGKKVVYKGGRIPLSILKDGKHILKYYSVDNVGNKEEETEFNFYLDKISPILTNTVLGDKYIVNDQVYFSGRTKMKLIAVDNKSGVKDVMYSINKSEFKKYDEAFYLPRKPGYHTVNYFAVDSLSNSSNTSKSGAKYETYKYNVNKIYLDLTGPTLNHKYTGNQFKTRDTLFINKTTKIHLSAIDKESGMQYISYSIDGTQEETKYTVPFSIKNSGVHIVEYFAYDNVNNRNIGKFMLVCDNEAPVPIYNFSVESLGEKDGLKVYPNYVNLYLAATDKLLGTDKIFYSLNGQAEKSYNFVINNFKKNSKNTIIIRVTDKLQNENNTIIEFYTE